VPGGARGGEAIWPRAALLAAAVAVFYLAVFPTADSFVRATDSHPGLFADFWEYDYPMGQSLLSTHRPVKGFVYSPGYALLFVPFGALSLGAALWAWGALLVLGVAVLAWLPSLLFRGHRGGAAFTLLALFLTLTSFPVVHNFRWGQNSLFVTALVLGAFLLAGRGGWAVPSLLLALAVSLKFFPFLFLLPFLMRKDLRLLGGTAAWGALLLLALPALVLGAGDTVAFYRQVFLDIREIGFRAQWQGGNTLYLPHVAARLAGQAGNASILLQGAAAAAGYLVFLGNLLLLWRVRERAGEAWLPWAFCLLFLSQPLLLSTSWPSYFTGLPFCQAFVAWDAWRGGWTGRSGAVAALAALSAALSSVFVFLLFPSHLPYGHLGVLLWADLLLLAAAWLRLTAPSARDIFRITNSSES